MPFGHHNLSVLAYANGFTHFLYKAGETPLSEVCARGYFNDGRTLLVPGSMLTIVTTNGCTIRFVGRSPDDHVITRAPAVVEEAPTMEPRDMSALTADDIRGILRGLDSVKELTDLLRHKHLDVPFLPVALATVSEAQIRAVILRVAITDVAVEPASPDAGAKA